jgi:2-dehydro-3-deoxygluconokinase
VSTPPDVVTFGETMAAMRGAGPLRLGGALYLSIAGAESNVAIGLARLGHRAAWAGRVGDDEFGELVLRTLRAENVDVSGAEIDPGRPTGLIFFEQRTADITRVQYYRAGSAASALAPGKPHVPNAPGFLHLTGITPALGDDAARAVVSAAERARAAGRAVSLDVNYRARLWSAAAARPVLRSLVPLAGIVFGSEAELALLANEPAAEVKTAASELLALGVQAVVVKQGAAGAIAHTADGAVSVPARRVRAVDTVGAGDAFAAGYLSAALDGLDTAERLRRAAAVSAFAVGSAGDWEGLPTRRDLSLLDAEEETIR